MSTEIKPGMRESATFDRNVINEIQRAAEVANRVFVLAPPALRFWLSLVCLTSIANPGWPPSGI